MTAAETIRENDSHSSIGIISSEPHLVYSRLLLPKFLKKEIPRSKLFLRTAEDFTKKSINLHLGEAATFVDTKRREVGVTDGYTIGYHKLLLASGGKVKQWGSPEDQKYVYQLHTLNDAERMAQAINIIKNPLIIGFSFLGLELLEIFVSKRITPVIILNEKTVLEEIFDSQGGDILRNAFERHGIQIYFNDTIGEIVKRDGGLKMYTKSLKEINADALVLGGWLERNTDFLRESGIEYGEGGIKANEFLETNLEGIFVAGDAAEFYDVILGEWRVAGDWTSAFLQGRVVGLNMVGKKQPFKNVSSYSVSHFGLQITVVGECDSKTPSVVRLDARKNQYEIFFIKNNVLVGAALINRFIDKPQIAKLIEQKTPMEQYQEKLKDFEFDIRQIT